MSPVLILQTPHRRYDLLNQTIAAVVRHLEQYEPDIKYEMALVDNGQQDKETFEYAQLRHGC